MGAQDREFVDLASQKVPHERSERARDAAAVYLELPGPSTTTVADAEVAAFTAGWDAATQAVLAEVSALLAPEAFLTSAGVSSVVRRQLEGIARRFEVEL